jgi:ethanolamine utilization protein EutA (predicted chaperonin)
VIDLEPEISLRFYPIYKLTKVKQQALKDFVRENLQLRRIKPSQSLAGYLVLFIPKKNRKLRICINYK